MTIFNSIPARPAQGATVPIAGSPPIDADFARRIKAANAALDRIGAVADDWLIVGDVYISGRQEAMAETRTNTPRGKSYNRALDAWAVRVQFDLCRIDENTRTALAHIMENRPAFDAWRAALSTNQRQEWNHPRTLWRRFESTRIAKTTPEGSHAGKTPRPTAKDLTVELNVMKRELAKARDGQLLIDLARDSDDSMTRIMFQEPAVLTQPRRFAALFRRWACKLEEQAARPRNTERATGRRDQRAGGRP